MQQYLKSGSELDALLDNLADQIMAGHPARVDLCLLGIMRRGADLAARLRQILEQKGRLDVLLGTLDISLYRDDWTSMAALPALGESNIPTSLENKTVLLVDDVLYTGRTIRAALEAILDYGRPAKVELLVLVDRGLRELPIQADFTGLHVKTEPGDQVDVLLSERDGEDGVRLTKRSSLSPAGGEPR